MRGAIALLLAGASCSKDPEKIEPEARGQRGESCQARNDCAKGLACISGVCSKNDFDIAVKARQCDVIECERTADCCGGKPTEAPAACARRTTVCTPTLPGCQQAACTTDANCGAGTCGLGYCSNSTLRCDSASDCADTCVNQLCTLSGVSCIDNACPPAGTCQSRTCMCANPAYDPTDPICTNPDCVDLCQLRCEDERCVPDTSCEDDADCRALGSNICDDGRCVECLEDDDCDEEGGEECIRSRCQKPCTEDEECPFFHQCQNGECVETGCSSHRECVLAASRQEGGEDARLSQCLPSDADPEIKTCKIACQNDGECASDFQSCDNGFCKFIGCESDEDCRAYLGIQKQQKTEARPYVTRAICRP
jgi:hypothetical protein